MAEAAPNFHPLPQIPFRKGDLRPDTCSRPARSWRRRPLPQMGGERQAGRQCSSRKGDPDCFSRPQTPQAPTLQSCPSWPRADGSPAPHAEARAHTFTLKHTRAHSPARLSAQLSPVAKPPSYIYRPAIMHPSTHPPPLCPALPCPKGSSCFARPATSPSADCSCITCYDEPRRVFLLFPHNENP